MELKKCDETVPCISRGRKDVCYHTGTCEPCDREGNISPRPIIDAEVANAALVTVRMLRGGH